MNYTVKIETKPRLNSSTSADPIPDTSTITVTGNNSAKFARDMVEHNAAALKKIAGVQNGSLELIVCAAVKVDDLVIPSVRHFDSFTHDIITRLGVKGKRDQQGFITNRYRFVDRVEGLAIARAAGQVVQEVGGSDKELFSECMW